MARPRSTPGKRLTEAELELMRILWRLGEGCVSDVIAALPAGRELAYTSVSTILRILENKGVLRARKEGRGHIYTPVLGRQEYEAGVVTYVVDRVFDGAPTALVRQLIDNVDLSDDDVREIRRLLKNLREKS